MKRVPPVSIQEDIQMAQDGRLASASLAFMRQVQMEKERDILEIAKQSYRDSTLTPKKALCVIAELVGLDELRLRLEQIAHQGLVSEERSRKHG